MLLLKIITVLTLMLAPVAAPITQQASPMAVQSTATSSGATTADEIWEPFPQCYPCPTK